MTEYSDNWYLSFVLPADAVPFFERALDFGDTALLANEIEKGADAGKWRLEAIFDGKPDTAALDADLEIAAAAAGIALPAYALEQMEAHDWLRESLESFKPVEIGRFYIYGSHIKDAPPAGKTALMIDAATAFGSGEHNTTRGCLEAFEEILKTKTPRKILDMGCGSGILSLATAAVLPDARVMAVDIDPESVRVAAENAVKNKLSATIDVMEGDGYRDPRVRENAPYDIVFENILARPLMMMAPDLAANLAADGFGILSGMLTEQADMVEEAHKAVGLRVLKRYVSDEWTTMVVGR